ncbi:ATP-dependent DNA helicase RecG [Candidatus Falkowbacteria bacterium CG11_big_fil_rev_8_21_14_0_20_39_10]|uniref:Probable DNA 3'-5' helicase RecG n=1 Tax=Candidatus Falkowbacteria bacterium CG11_big_fil_rev_8_21_14_0_20_39_10 TaxID=1974570 RepID=A0A2M6K9W5_9BACT|nr:MAG: ATP-dependent DNA helicase RecG [Candidatus Falkowbacteria bacterium CG11_big_fil_rev_8_21_14_0_20_39_10]
MLTLESDIAKITRVGVTTAKRLKKIGLETVHDLLFYFPFRYEDFSRLEKISDLKAGQNANIVGQIELISNKRSPRKRMYITEALVSDETETIKVIWFNQPFIARNLKTGDKVSLAGKIEDDYGSLIMKSPIYEKITYIPPSPLEGEGSGVRSAIHTQGIVPIYHLTSNITQKQIRFLIKQIINLSQKIPDWLPTEIKKSQKLADLSQALEKIHFPKTEDNIAEAKKRLGFDELLLIQLESQLIKKELESKQAQPLKFREKETKKFVNSLPFKLTNAQRKASWEILKDLEKDKPMARLLEGDVGSGKTVVAVIAMLSAALSKKQAVLMVPTEILAQQHYDNITKLLKDFDIKIGLVTRSAKKMNYESGIMNHESKDKKTQKKDPNSLFIIHNSQIIIGTHALIQEKIKFNNLAIAIIDEQHRFGVEQRKALLRINADTSGLTRTDISENKLLYEDLTYKIRGAIFNVKKQLGLGHKEKIYQNALVEEFKKLKINFDKEKSIEIKYDNKKVGAYRPDFIIENKIILETKKLPFIGKFEKEQVWHYLKGSDYKLALLVNFAKDDVHVERFIHSNKKTSSPHQSASVSMSPHLLSMTATPIPRSLALALYGDLDLSIINEMPRGRIKISTHVVPEIKRQDGYNFIRQQIKDGRQVFVICPLIDISDKLGVKSVKEEYKKLNEQIFPDLKIGMLHGKLKAKDKEKIMQDFLAGIIKILVSTSVVEVGVDVPNAAIMMIEGADRFGLAQLHQFRGRVGRSHHQSYCFLFTDNDQEKALKRLESLTKHHDGFELAKMDLKFRGPGQVYGTAQKGFPELKIASLFDYELMKQAQLEAKKIISQDPGLKNYPLLKEKLGELETKAHLE